MRRPLFVYGSLRDASVRRRLLGERAGLTARPAVLRGYARELTAAFDYPFLVPADAAAQVDGELLDGLTAADYAILDRYEDLDEGLYVRALVTVQAADGPIEAWAYLKGPAAPPAAPPGAPSYD